MSDAAMNRPAPPQHFPRGILLGAGALILVTILAAAAGRLGGQAPLHAPSAALVALDLRFEDRDDGSVVVLDASHSRELLRAEPGTNGFMRSTMRGLARERRASGLGADVPFRLTQWADGRLTLDDPATGRRVELEAFGASNHQVFARLLPPLPAAVPR